jgi:N-methylhydantoinase B
MIAEEMSANLIRASYSPNIKERKDASCAIFDAEGRLIAQADNVPGHLGAMPHSVRRLIEAFGTDEFRAGDTVVNNMPYGAGAGSHLPDVTMVTPIVFEGRTVGYAGNLAHHADVGGSTPGSFAADNKTIFQEGLQIPPVKLYEDDTLREEIMEFILTNVRTPEERRGDLRAQYGSNRTGRERLLELVEEWSVETIEAAFEALLDYSEARTRKSIRNLPDGEYSFADTMDGDGRETSDVQIAADVDISDGTITVDLSDSDEQVPGVINAPFSVTRATVYYVVRCVTDPEIPPNDGCYRPISVVAPEGSVVRPQRPAAVAGGIETEQRIADVLFGALESAGVRPVMAAANGSMSTVTFGGARPDDDSPYTYYETIGGGYGARTDRDGVHGVHAHLTNTQNTPIEAFEMSYPLRVERYALRQDTGGAGAYQGGMGIRRDIRVLDHVADFSLMSERRRSRPYGLAGGKKGSKGADFHVSNGERTRIDAKTTRELQPGDLVSVRTPGGGGYGPPEDRDEVAIRRDFDEDRISEAFIAEHYADDE